MNWLSLVLQVLTSLPGIISGVESAKPTTPGAGKKVTVLDQVATAMAAADPIYGPLIAGHPAVQAAVSAATDAIVDVFNKSAAVATEQATAAATAPVVPPPPPPPPVASAAGPATIASAAAAAGPATIAKPQHDGLP